MFGHPGTGMSAPESVGIERFPEATFANGEGTVESAGGSLLSGPARRHLALLGVLRDHA